LQGKRKKSPRAISKSTITSSNPLKKKRNENVDTQLTTLSVSNIT